MVSGGKVGQRYGPHQVKRVEVKITVAPGHYCIEADQNERPVAVGSFEAVIVVSLQAFKALLHRQMLQGGQGEENGTNSERQEGAQMHEHSQRELGQESLARARESLRGAS